MTQEEKSQLLKDLCMRLPYGVKCNINGEDVDIGFVGITGEVFPVKTGIGFSVYEDVIKSYLRPMSSMTEEEKKEILQSLNIHGDIDNEGNLLLGVECDIITLKVCKKYLGELNKRMFDVCHMIEKGLALEAPEGMYEI